MTDRQRLIYVTELNSASQHHTRTNPEFFLFQLSEALGKLYGQSKQGTSSDSVEPSKPRGGAHENCITCIVPLTKGRDGTIKRFSTSGLDGKIVVWDLENHMTIAK